MHSIIFFFFFFFFWGGGVQDVWKGVGVSEFGGLWFFDPCKKFEFLFLHSVLSGGGVIIMRPMALTSSRKTPCLYQVPKLRNLNLCFCTVCSFFFWGRGSSSSWGRWPWRPWCPRENPRSLSSPKADKFDILKNSTDRPTNRGTYTIH